MREEKERGESQLAALGSNLATVRQQLEGEKRRGKEMERRGKMQDTRVDGKKACILQRDWIHGHISLSLSLSSILRADSKD